MSAPIPTLEPTTLTQGDSWVWELSLPNYPANAGWVLSYALRSTSGFLNFSGTADGTNHKISVAPTSTAGSANFGAGDYDWEASVANAGTGERYTIRRGKFVVLADLSAAGGAFDGRSFNKKMLDAIRAVLLGYTTNAVAEYRIHNREIKYMDTRELMRWEAFYESKVRAENGQGQGRKLGVAFGLP